MPTLLIEFPDGSRSAFRMEAGTRWLVGTDPRCSLRLPSGSAEPFHCEFFCSSLRWQVRDLLSASGTFVGGMAVSQLPLASGDVIEVGQQRLTFFLEDRSAACAACSAPISRAERAGQTLPRALKSAAAATAAGRGSSVAQKLLASLVLVVGLAAAFAILSGAFGPFGT